MSTAELMATDLCERIQIEKHSRAFLRDDLTALEFVHALADADQFKDAARILAFILPAREGIWWGIQCARQNLPEHAEPEFNAALAAAEKWVLEMSEEARYAAQVAAESAGLGTAAGCVAMAAFASGNSLAPPGQEAVPPEPALASELVAGSILASALPPNPAQASERYRTFLHQGIEMIRALQEEQRKGDPIE